MQTISRRKIVHGLLILLTIASSCVVTSCSKKEDTTAGYVEAPTDAGPSRKGAPMEKKNAAPTNIQSAGTSKE